MNITKRQLQTQNAILLAVHGTDDIEEARKKDLGFGCITEYNKGEYAIVSRVFTMSGIVSNLYEAEKKGLVGYIGHVGYSGDTTAEHIVSIIGQPPTLERVLYAIGLKEGKTGNGYFVSHTEKLCRYTRPVPTIVCNWKLLKEGGTQASLRDQSQETQDVIYSLLVNDDTKDKGREDQLHTRSMDRVSSTL